MLLALVLGILLVVTFFAVPCEAAGDSRSPAATPSIWPVAGAVTSGFGWRLSPIEGSHEWHQGIDIAAETGTPVVSAANGHVLQSGWTEGYGYIVQIDHGSGLTTVYGHNSAVTVRPGEKVRMGQVIAYAGSTGRSTGPHLHYEVRLSNTAVDPWPYLIAY